jgi:hypothetical protein
MTMPNAAHPDPERLSALAGNDADARADSALVAHVTSCDACDRQVRELGSLRMALAEMPDLAPSRPLQYVPPVAASAPSGWRVAVRRAFAPMAVAGMALLLVGGIGATGVLGPADAQQLLPLFSAARPATEGAQDSNGDGGAPVAPTATNPPDRGVNSLGPSPLGEAAGGENGGVDEQPEPPAEEPAVQGGDTDEGSPVTSGWVVVAALGAGLLVLAVVLRAAAPSRARTAR